ncbi:MAG: CPBP family intramembrane metalloprotease [Prevotella sp.]|nr:CPBP family intramembrane metalloprotease [Prevotella sp.]
MSKIATIIKPLLPILSAVYGLALIYLTALPIADGEGGLAHEALVWILTLAAILLTYFVVIPIERKAYPESRQFSLKLPTFPVAAGLLLLAPLWLTMQEFIVYALTSLVHPVQTEPLVCTPDELREDLLAGVHAVFLAPILEELCYRQLPISPFRRRWVQILVCVIMAVLFGILHIRNFMGASLAALLFGLVYIWSRNIWYAILLHAGSNLTATLLAIYSTLGFGEIQTCKIPVIFLPDWKVFVASFLFAVLGVALLKRKRY